MAKKVHSNKQKASTLDPLYDQAVELVKAKVESSGLNFSHIDLLGMEVLCPVQTTSLHSTFKPNFALKINYYDPRDLSSPLSGHPKWPPFYRLRYLRPGGDAKDDVRYTNEPNAGVVAYFPKVIDWPTVITDPDCTIIITEGELKAAKACVEGFPCIGLGGVWNFRSSTLGTTFLAELECINWVKRRVYIVYDSDIISKPGVQDAMNSLAEELMERGALPFIVYIPDGDDGKKQGLDDWCVNNPGSTIYELCARHQPLTQVRKLWELNESIIYVKRDGIIVELDSKNKMSTGQFKEVYGNVDYAELTVNDAGNVSLKKAPIAPNWLKWKLRSDVNSMTYQPGKPQIIDQHIPAKSSYNLWPGWGCEPIEGDVSPFLELIDNLFKGSRKEDVEWFLDWCAYPFQYPGVKMYSAVVIHGRLHGTGKSLVGYTLGRIYGDNFTEITQDNLHGGFNSWAEAKQLVMGDDVTGSNKRADNDVLKKMITQRKLRVNVKFMPEYEVPDCINYIFTSNHPDAFFLEDDDRRFFIHEVLSPPMSEDFYMDYGLWLDTTGPSALFHWLLNRDVSGFNPMAAALRTIAKEQMTADTRSDLSEWVHKLRIDPDSMLKLGGIALTKDLYTPAELLALYDPEGMKRLTANGLSRELRRAGVQRANNGQPIRGPNGLDRYYVVRNADKWVNLPHKDLVEHLTGASEKEKPKKKGKF